MLIAVHLASCATMRCSEICGLQAKDIKGNVIHVHRAAVLDDNKKVVLKTTKTISSDRYIMERGGWASDEVLKRIYRGTMSDYRKRFIEQTNEHFEKYTTKCNTNFKNL